MKYDLDMISDLYSEYKGKEQILAKKLDIRKNVLGRRINRIAMQYGNLNVGGVERVISLLSFLFKEDGLEVTLIFDDKDEDFFYPVPDGVEICKIPSLEYVKKSGDYSARAIKLAEILSKKKIDLMINHAYASELLLYDFLTYRSVDVYAVVLQHGLFCQDMIDVKSYLWQQRHVFPLYDRVVTLGEAESVFWDIYGVQSKFIPNPSGEKGTIKKKIIKENGKTIIWVGRVASSQKQVLDVVPIMKDVVGKIPDAQLKIYGPVVDEKAYSELIELINNNGLSNNITYYGNAGKELEQVYNSADVHLLTSSFESYGMVIFESKCKGVPLVLYDLPYLELLRNKKGYIAVTQGDVVAAAEAVVQILSNVKLKRQLSEDAIESVRGFNDSDILKLWKELFQELESGSFSCDIKYNKFDYKIILDLIRDSYQMGVEKKNILEKQNKELIQELEFIRLLKVLNTNKNKRYAIFPYGNRGIMVKDMLEEYYGISIDYKVDNKKCITDKEFISTFELKKNCNNDIIVLFCCTNKSIKDNLWEELLKCVPQEQVIDVFNIKSNG